MSRCMRPGNSARRHARADSYSMVTRSWLIRRVLSGHCGGSLASSAKCSSYAKRGTLSSGCGSRYARLMRPSAIGAKNGRRLPEIRLRTSAVMNTVLPERANPVTPSRSVGVMRSAKRAPRVRAVCEISVEDCTPIGRANPWPRQGSAVFAPRYSLSMTPSAEMSSSGARPP